MSDALDHDHDAARDGLRMIVPTIDPAANASVTEGSTIAARHDGIGVLRTWSDTARLATRDFAEFTPAEVRSRARRALRARLESRRTAHTALGARIRIPARHPPRATTERPDRW